MTDLLTLMPEDAGYAEATAAFSVLQTPAPARAVRVRTREEAAAAVRWAAAEGLRVAPYATGHAAGRLGSLDDAVLVRTAIDEPIGIDAAARTARIPAGTTWTAVVAAAAEHGLLAPHGSSGTVGAVGYLLSGGLGFTGRTTGVASNAVVAVEYVDADGGLHRADAEHEPDRFWALRGGGAGVGLVTAVEVRLIPGDRVVTGARFWPGAVAAALLRVWRDWAADAPDSITTTARVLRLPPLPHLPPALTGGPVVAIDGVALPGEGGGVASARAVADALLDRLDAVAGPVLDTWHEGDAVDALATHMDPQEPAPGWTQHDLLSGLSDESIDAIADASIGESPLVSTELRQLGGAFARPQHDGGFFDRVEEPFLLQGVAIAPAPEVVAAAQRHMAALRKALAPMLTSRSVPTFLESAEDGRLAAADDAMARLAGIRREADPQGRFAVRP